MAEMYQEDLYPKFLVDKLAEVVDRLGQLASFRAEIATGEEVLSGLSEQGRAVDAFLDSLISQADSLCCSAQTWLASVEQAHKVWEGQPVLN